MERLNQKYFVALLFLLIPFALYAKSYTIDRIDIQAELMHDGSLKIEETRTYSFHGSFSWADYLLPLKAATPGQSLGTVKDFELSDGNSFYRESSDKSPGTYILTLGSEKMHVKWFYRAQNETRSFTLRYTVTDAVTAYSDISDFCYQFVGRANEKQIGTVEVSIRLPQPARYGEVRAWAHGPLWGKTSFDYGILKMFSSPLPPRHCWEARITFPASWIPDAAKRIDRQMLNTIIEEETRLAEEANAARERARQDLIIRSENERLAWHIAAVLSIVGAAGVIFFFFKFGQRAQVSYNQDVDPTIPDHPPAIFSGLYYNKMVTGNALVATLFDLARRGFISIEQKEPVERKWWRIDRTLFLIKANRDKWMAEIEKLAPYERSLLDFTFNDLGEGKEAVDFLDFRKHPGKVRKWFYKWREILLADLKTIPFYTKESKKGTIYSAIFSALIVIGGIATLVTLGRPGLMAAICGLLYIVSSIFILRLTPEMKQRKRQWRAFRKYLTRYYFASETDTGFLFRMPDFLIYGLAMGVGSTTIRRLMEHVPSDQRTTYFPWYVYSHGAGMNVPAADFASAISSMVSVASSTMSSTTGAGGGASAGGGGGAGGASGGAG